MRSLRLLTAVGAGLLLAACGDHLTEPLGPEPPAPTTQQGSLDPVFAAAAAEFGVPSALLKAIGYTETRWEMVRGAEEFPGMAPAFGVMALRGERLQRGARLAGVSDEAARTDAVANIRAAAALLRVYADELGIRSVDVAQWAPAVARYSGIQSPEGQAEYVHSDVYAVLSRGAAAKLPSGEPLVSLAPVRATPDFPRPSATEASREGPRFSTSAAAAAAALNIVWRPSPNYNDRPSGTSARCTW